MFDRYIKDFFINQTLKFPLRTLLITFGLTLLLSIGLKWLIIDDDFIKLMPKNIPSRIIWDEIQEDFGASELMLIAFGDKNIPIYRKEVFEALSELTDSLKNNPLVEEVISIKTIDKIDFEKDEFGDEWTIFNPLIPNGLINDSLINSVKEYLEDNPTIKKRIVSTHNDYTSIIIRPKLNKNMVTIVESITPLRGSKYLGTTSFIESLTKT